LNAFSDVLAMATAMDRPAYKNHFSKHFRKFSKPKCGG
jgi:hypothetical protein